MASQTMLAGMKFSITGTTNSHAGFENVFIWHWERFTFTLCTSLILWQPWNATAAYMQMMTDKIDKILNMIYKNMLAQYMQYI